MRCLFDGPVELSDEDPGATCDVEVMVGTPAPAGGLLVVLEAPTSWRIDLGLFDPSGFRGWSGSARRVVWVGPDAATPGYLPGEVVPGGWRVRLGAHAIPERRVEVGLSVFASEPKAAAAPADRSRPRLPVDDTGRWVRGDLHAHSVHSDGVLGVGELAAWAAARGLDFLAVSDHNTVSHHAELPAAAARAGLTLLPAQEVTTSRGHAVLVGVSTWADPTAGVAHWLELAEAAGGVLVAAHPLDGTLGWRLEPPGPTALLEAWNGGWSPDAHDGLARQVEALWRIGGRGFVGGSDLHAPGARRAPGTPTTWVRVPLRRGGDGEPLPAPEILAGLRSGATTVSASPNGPVIVPLEEGRVCVVGGEGLELVGTGGRRSRVTSPQSDLSAEREPLWLEGDGKVWAAWAPPSPPLPAAACDLPGKGQAS